MVELFGGENTRAVTNLEGQSGGDLGGIEQWLQPWRHRAAVASRKGARSEAIWGRGAHAQWQIHEGAPAAVNS
jgi:hypothetical protein